MLTYENDSLYIQNFFENFSLFFKLKIYLYLFYVNNFIDNCLYFIENNYILQLII